MSHRTGNAGTIYQRGDIWWVKIYADGHPVYESSRSTKRSDATKLRDKLLAQRYRGELSGGAPDTVLIGELLDDVLKSDIKPQNLYIWGKVVEIGDGGLTVHVRCAECAGLGVVGDEQFVLVTCPSCGGTGEVAQRAPLPELRQAKPSPVERVRRASASETVKN
jgi:hypothetical protein